VTFYYDAVQTEVGRRTVVREFPNRDTPHSEDLGKRARRFTIDGYLLGADYDVDRDRLVAAFEQEGQGRLVHPYWGDRVVVLDGPVRFSETVGEGAKASFSATFVDAGDPMTPARARSSGADLDNEADVAAAALEADTAATFNVAGQVGDVADAAVELGTLAVSTLRSANGKAKSALGVADTASDTLDQLEAEMATLVATPDTLAARVRSAIAEVVAVASDVDDATLAAIADGTDLEVPYSGGPLSDRFRADIVLTVFRAFASYGDDLDAIDTTTPEGVQQQVNADAFVLLVQAAGAIETARAAAELVFDSFDQAVEFRDELSEAIEELLPSVDDETFARLSGLRAKLQQKLTSTAETLPRVVTFTPSATMPALVVAQRLYGDPERDVDIIARNNPSRPAFLEGGEPLQVLADV
jgi:prophage DNA circulation protein